MIGKASWNPSESEFQERMINQVRQMLLEGQGP